MFKKMSLFMTVVFIGLFLVGCQKASYEELIDAGETAFMKKDYSKAKLQFKRATKLREPDNKGEVYHEQVAQYQVALNLMIDDKFDEARKVLSTVHMEDGLEQINEAAKELEIKINEREMLYTEF